MPVCVCGRTRAWEVYKVHLTIQNQTAMLTDNKNYDTMCVCYRQFVALAYTLVYLFEVKIRLMVHFPLYI